MSPESPVQPSGRTPAAWGARIRAGLVNGQVFHAYDDVREAVAQHPDDVGILLFEVLTLVRAGALTQAVERLQRASASLELRGAFVARVWQSLRTIVQADNPDAVPPEHLDTLAVDLLSAGKGAGTSELPQTEVLELMADVRRGIWRRTMAPGDLRHAVVAQHRLYTYTRERRHGVAAAVLHRLVGDVATGQALARELSQVSRGRPAESPADMVGEGMLCVLLGETAQAADRFAQARRTVGGHHVLLADAVFDLKLLARAGQPVPEDVFVALRPPVIALFVADPLWDAAGALPTPEREEALRLALIRQIEELDVEIAYGLVSAGPELLFLEAMLDRRAEVNLLLPFQADDIRRSLMASAGPGWVRRFDNVMTLASAVHLVTDEPSLGDEELVRYAHRVMDGSARMRAGALETDPHLIAAIDLDADGERTSAMRFVDAWGDPARLRILDVTRTPAPCAPVSLRHLRTMLFADIVGYSQIPDEKLPHFWEYLCAIRDAVGDGLQTPNLTESWGDALYIAMDSARALAELAHTLTDAFADLDATSFGLDRALSLRIGLHAGPVYLGRHPMTGRDIVFGSHVNRAARIEPITVPGCIYASQNFVALLVSEESEREAEARILRQPYRPPFQWVYLGVHALTKNFGTERIYHLTRTAV